MPNASERLREIFGISEEKAEQVIKNHGGDIVGNGLIRVPFNYKQSIQNPEGDPVPRGFIDACDFLIDEWDYDFEE
jgi:hypothetical protein